MPQRDGYPSLWSEYDRHVVHTGSDFYGFTPDIGDVNRFGARFRAAASFRGVSLDGYTLATAAGYSALCRVLFTWSAFESFMAICGLNQRSVAPMLVRYGALKMLADIRRMDVGNRFYGFIYERVNAAHRRELESYFNADPVNVTYMASSIRHIFAHGSLSPNAAQVDPNVAIDMCNLISDFLMSIMDDEFANRIDRGMREIYGIEEED